MKRILTARQMRWADQRAVAQGTPEGVLMGRAGRAVANAVLQWRPDSGRVVIVAGPGNNGGDGYAAACVLAGRNMQVTVVSVSDPDELRGDVAEYAGRARQAGVKVRFCGNDGEALDRWLSRSIIVVDALFGTGLARPLHGRVRKMVDDINASDRPVLSVDIPSGIHGDSGKVMGAAVRADWTLPIATTKWGHWLDEGRDFSGHILPPADIGISEAFIHDAYTAVPNGVIEAVVLDEAIIRAAFSGQHPRDAHKASFGHVWVFGGSPGYTGAPRLAAMGAMGVHAGLASIACDAPVYPVIAASCLEVMVHPQDTAPWQSAHALIAGPGWGTHQQPLLQEILAADIPLVLDADALNMLASDETLKEHAKKRSAVTVFTPHVGEAARLLGCSTTEVRQDRLGSALRLVELLHGWVVLKGAETLVVSPGFAVWVCPFGSNRLATAGSGDVLAGAIAGLLGQGIEVSVAVPAAVGLHAMAGEQSGWYRAGQLPDRMAAIRDTI